MAKILIVEDDRALNRGIRALLERSGHEVCAAFSYSDALSLLKDVGVGVDLFLLDVALPDGDGRDVCRAIRERYDTPVIFLTASDTDADVVAGFRLGCDDYLSKPFSNEVLVQRIAAVLRRSTDALSGKRDEFVYGELRINFSNRNVWSAGKNVRLTPREFDLLALLVKNKGKIVTRNMLLEQIWDADGEFVDDNTVSVTVRRLRSKIEPKGAAAESAASVKPAASVKSVEPAKPAGPAESVKPVEPAKPIEPEYIRTVFGIGYTFGK
ncbi:MAG: response regulator transcription factor [Clostridiales Family XIII bacterium]|jgi:DNA-binding response OmpR family regulator|nr:response regulator transcription factor [Clostridiales Family XIII bacterium]